MAPPNYFRWVKTGDSGGGGGGGTWSVNSYGRDGTDTYTAHTAPASPWNFIIYAGHGIVVTSERDTSGGADGTQYISIWEEDETTDFRLAPRWNHTASDGTNGNGFNFQTWNDGGSRPVRASYRNAAYDKANDDVYFIGTAGTANGADFDDTNDHSPTLFKATRTSGAGTSFSTGLTNLGNISSSLFDGWQSRDVQNHRIIRVCNDELITMCDEDNGFTDGRGNGTSGTQDGGAVFISTKSGVTQQKIFAGEIYITGTLGAEGEAQHGRSYYWFTTTDYGQDSFLGNYMAVDYNQSYFTVGRIFKDANSWSNAKAGFVIYKSGSSGYERCGQITGSTNSNDHNEKTAQMVDAVAFNDDYFVYGHTHSTGGGFIEVHKRTASDWATSELVLTISGTQAAEDAGLTDTFSNEANGMFGGNVAMNSSGDLMIAAYKADQSGTDSKGAIYFYDKDTGSDTWSFNAAITGSSTTRKDYFDPDNFLGNSPMYIGENSTAAFNHRTGATAHHTATVKKA